jgi:hypothetical protein
MKKIFLLLICIQLLSNVQSFAQVVYFWEFTDKAITNFRSSKTYCVLTGNIVYDEAITKAMAECWYVTPYSFIPKDSLKHFIKDKSSAFLIPAEAGDEIKCIALVPGGKGDLRYYRLADLLAYAPVNSYDDEPKIHECAFRVRNMLEGIIRAMDIMQERGKFGVERTAKLGMNLADIYNENAHLIKEKTLLVCESHLAPKFQKEQLAAVYPYKFEVCSKEKIARAIAEKSTEYYYFQPCITGRRFLMVIDPSNGKVLYYHEAPFMANMSLRANDFKSLTEKVEAK